MQRNRHQFVFGHASRVHDLVVGDSRHITHHGRAYDDMHYQRDMRRVTRFVTAPTLEQSV